MRAPHEVLRIPADADLPTIKQAFRRLAKELHPDRTRDPRDGARLREVIAAYREMVAELPFRAKRPTASAEPWTASAVDFDFAAPARRWARDVELDGLSGAALCTPEYQERLTRVVVGAALGTIALFWASALISHL
jgi:hypothetical protein